MKSSRGVSLVLSAAALVVLFSQSLFAQIDPTRGYYPVAFEQMVQSGLRGPELRDQLATIIRQTHRTISYREARQFLLGRFYLVRSGNAYSVRDVYCQAQYGPEVFPSKEKPGPSMIPDDKVINIEHTWPQSKFTNRYPDNIQKSDVHHLYPTDSQMNSARSSFPFGEVVKDRTELKCKTGRLGSISEGGSGGIYFEPPQAHKGNVARAIFYFATKYDMTVDEIQERYLRKWHKEDPVDAEEVQRNDEIQKIQGSRNPFVDHPEYVDLIQNF